MNHTPGPWYYSTRYSTTFVTTAPMDGDAISLNGQYVGEFRHNGGEGVANARLCAAAPELLEALYAALPFVEDAEGDESYKPDSVKKVTGQIRTAIAKAEGRA